MTIVKVVDGEELSCSRISNDAGRVMRTFWLDDNVKESANRAVVSLCIFIFSFIYYKIILLFYDLNIYVYCYVVTHFMYLSNRTMYRTVITYCYI